MDNVGGGEVESGRDNRVSDGTAPQLFTCLPQRIRSSRAENGVADARLTGEFTVCRIDYGIPPRFG